MTWCNLVLAAQLLCPIIAQVVQKRTGAIESDIELFVGWKAHQAQYRALSDIASNPKSLFQISDPSQAPLSALREWVCATVVDSISGEPQDCATQCGPTKGFVQCCEALPFCNEASGWCGNTRAHRDAQPGDAYDYGTTGKTCERVTQWSKTGHLPHDSRV